MPLSNRIASISQQQLQQHKQKRFVELLDAKQGKLGVVVSFVAVLELIKRQLIEPFLNQIDGEDEAERTNNLNDMAFRWVA